MACICVLSSKYFSIRECVCFCLQNIKYKKFCKNNNYKNARNAYTQTAKHEKIFTKKIITKNSKIPS
ncbi:unnamed protein product [Meloidogyne enterolobii]|uniref:Uncharacterized protein n=1 Tax=Meloidogyne enterolobii TaxID=390850 RepID=A0ACB0YU03_MELEN